jgi:hypothetical protein
LQKDEIRDPAEFRLFSALIDQDRVSLVLLGTILNRNRRGMVNQRFFFL